LKFIRISFFADVKKPTGLSGGREVGRQLQSRCPNGDNWDRCGLGKPQPEYENGHFQNPRG
jgi:hypothetical protein